MTECRSFSESIRKILQCKALATGAGAGCIRVGEVKAFAFQAAGKLEGGITEVEEALEVGDDPDALVLKDLIVRLIGVVEVHLICQARASTACHGDTYKVLIGIFPVAGQNLDDLVPGCL